jgi:8-oxo-dGTP diphosphatase
MSIYLVRHASAGLRGDGLDDIARPLDPAGHVVADALAKAFIGVEIDTIYSSRALRCEQTVAALAASRSLPVVDCDEITEGSSAANAVSWCRSLVNEQAVLCSHGDVIPAILAGLMSDGMVVQGRRGCEKGSVWVLETSGRDIVAGRYFDHLDGDYALSAAIEA